MLLTFSFLALAAIPQDSAIQNTNLPNVATLNMRHAPNQILNAAAREYALRLQVLRNTSRSTTDVDYAADASILLFNEERPYNQGIARRSHVRRLELIEVAAREQFSEFTTSASYERLKDHLQRASEQ